MTADKGGNVHFQTSRLQGSAQKTAGSSWMGAAGCRHAASALRLPRVVGGAGAGISAQPWQSLAPSILFGCRRRLLLGFRLPLLLLLLHHILLQERRFLRRGGAAAELKGRG